MRFVRLAASSILLSAALWIVPACASRQTLLEVSGTIMYEKPAITGISHALTDGRVSGGSAVLKVVLTGDAGLSASFDVYPGVASRQPMTEVEEGRYVGEFTFPREVVGGPYTLIGRLKHEAAGEVTLRDLDLITIPMVDGVGSEEGADMRSTWSSRGRRAAVGKEPG